MPRRWLKAVSVLAHVMIPGLTSLKGRGIAGYRRVFRRPRQVALHSLRHLPLGSSPLIIDVGSATGQGAADIRRLARDVDVLALEPNPMLASRLRVRFAGTAAVRVGQYALSDVDGRVTLYVPVYNYTAIPELGSSNHTEAAEWLQDHLPGYRAELLTVAEFSCEARRLDTVHLTPTAVVIDGRCDASAIIRGGSRTLGASHPAILLERATIDGTCVDLMQALSYRAYRIEAARVSECSLDLPSDLLLGPAHASSLPFKKWIERSIHEGTKRPP